MATRLGGPALLPALLVTHKRRKLELASGAASQRGNHGRPGAAYNSKHQRNEERAVAEQAERAYQLLVARWQQKRPASSPVPA